MSQSHCGNQEVGSGVEKHLDLGIDPTVARDAAQYIHALVARTTPNNEQSAHIHATTLLRASALPMTLMAVDPTPAAPATAGTDSQIVKALLAAAQPPEKQVEGGHVPAGVVINLYPEEMYNGEARGTSYSALQGMTSLSQLYAVVLSLAARTKRGHPEPYSITDAKEVVQEWEDQADFAYQAMTIALAGFFSFQNLSAQTVKRHMTKAELHEGFLGKVFEGFNLTDSALQDMETILTNFSKALGSTTIVDESDTRTVNQTIRINSVPKINISGDNANPDWVWQPMCTLIYLKFTAKTWKTSVEKFTGGVAAEGFDFEMQMTSVRCQLNMQWYEQSEPKFDEVMRAAVGKSLKDFGAMISHNVTDKNQNNAIIQ